MSRTLTDLSQLSKSMFANAPESGEVKPAPPSSKPHDDGEEVLAYFSRSAVRAKSPQKASSAVPAANGAEALEREVADLRARLHAAEEALKTAEGKRLDSERERQKMADSLAASCKEVERLKGECGRLQGEARKAAPATSADEEASRVVAAETPASGVLAVPAAFGEAFPGELREMLLSALSEARDAAIQSARERRAAVLNAVLAANHPTGELERRRSELRQILKNAGYHTNPRALEELGFRHISGRTHWKIEYAGVRITMAKTPSDHRASLNATTEMVNRCF